MKTSMDDIDAEVTAAKMIIPALESTLQIVKKARDRGGLLEFIRECRIEKGRYLYRLPAFADDLKICLHTEFEVKPFSIGEFISMEKQKKKLAKGK